MEYVIILYVYPFRNFKFPESASFKLVCVYVGSCPAPVFSLVTTYRDSFLFLSLSLSFIFCLIYRTFMEEELFLV